jgi:hypothetical protein
MLFVFAFIGLISLVLLVDTKLLVFGLADEVVPGVAHEAFRKEWVMIEVDRGGLRRAFEVLIIHQDKEPCNSLGTLRRQRLCASA